MDDSLLLFHPVTPTVAAADDSSPLKLVICVICFVGDPHADKVLRLQLWQSNGEFIMEVRSSVCYNKSFQTDVVSLQKMIHYLCSVLSYLSLYIRSIIVNLFDVL